MRGRNSMRTVRFMAIALIAVVAACSPAFAANDTEVFDRTIPLPSGGTFTLTNVEGSIVVGKVLANKSASYGFDAQKEEYVDMLNAGIVDPAKVVRVALQDAASVAGLLITTEAMVAEIPKKEAAPAMPGGGGMGGMDF